MKVVNYALNKILHDLFHLSMWEKRNTRENNIMKVTMFKILCRVMPMIFEDLHKDSFPLMHSQM